MMMLPYTTAPHAPPQTEPKDNNGTIPMEKLFHSLVNKDTTIRPGDELDTSCALQAVTITPIPEFMTDDHELEAPPAPPSDNKPI